MALRSFKELIVWQRAMQLVEEIYRLTAKLPRQERFGLKSQMQRAAVSVASNIAEGYGRNHRGEYIHHLSIARGSLQELDTQLEIAVRLKFLQTTDAACSVLLLEETGKMLYQLNQSLRKP